MKWIVIFCSLLVVSVANGATSQQRSGREVTYYPNHKMESERFYKNGKKIGRHQTWYPSGKLKSRSTFAGPGKMARFEEWHENGKKASETEFKNGMEVSTKIYRRSGQIYINRVFRNGRMYGLPGGKACFRTKSDGKSL